MEEVSRNRENVKLTIIINGRGGVGKDTICDCAGLFYNVVNRTSVQPIKDIARMYAGYNGQKDDKTRKFLSDLKALFTDYNELPTQYLLMEYEKFMKDPNADIMFMHIREPEEINKMVNALNGECVTLLIRGRHEDKVYGNASDDNVLNYNYDYVYYNNKPLEDVPLDFKAFLDKMIDEEDNKKENPHEAF